MFCLILRSQDCLIWVQYSSYSIDKTLWLLFQTSNTDMYFYWDGFEDVEELKVGQHSTGIKEYILGIGKWL